MPEEVQNSEATHCPKCGKTDLVVVQNQYDPGCGCLGGLLFGWWGLLLGFLGSNNVELLCKNCGARWPVGRPNRAKKGVGCGLLILLFLLLILIIERCEMSL